MNNLLQKLQELTIQLTISPDNINHIADIFHQEILNGLAGKDSSLKMLPSYLNKPSGKEVGTFLALDFGGTNVRVLLTELLGQGSFKIHDHISVPLKDKAGHYNHISTQAAAYQLFDFIALQIAKVIKKDQTYSLGHTFSFPTHQTGINSSTLIHWTKEIETTGMDGHDITALLTAALTRQQLSNVLPQAIINDTVGALLTAAYLDQATDIGSICGTGHNTAYLEPSYPLTHLPMIINLESGNFNQLPFTTYDDQLDAHSEKPGAQRLEKMVSGHYIGELLRITACSLFDAGLLAMSTDRNKLKTPYLLTGAHLSCLHEDDTKDLTLIANWLVNNLSITNSSLQDRQILKSIASLISTRSARLVAATYLGIIKHIDPLLKNHHTIAIDGSLYEKLPGYGTTIQTTINQALGLKKMQVTTSLIKDGSGIGAAIATAIATNTK